MSMGYLNRNEGYGCVNGSFVDAFPKIAGVAEPQRAAAVGMGEFDQMGCNAGVNVGNITTRPTFIINDAVTWVKGAHTLKVGMEWRKIMGNIHANGNEAGTFNFDRLATGLGQGLGSPVASFLLGAVDNASVSDRSVSSHLRGRTCGSSCRRQLAGRQQADARLRPALGLLRAASEKCDRMSFFDPTGATLALAARPAGSPSRAIPPRCRLRRTLPGEGLV